MGEGIHYGVGSHQSEIVTITVIDNRYSYSSSNEEGEKKKVLNKSLKQMKRKKMSFLITAPIDKVKIVDIGIHHPINNEEIGGYGYIRITQKRPLGKIIKRIEKYAKVVSVQRSPTRCQVMTDKGLVTTLADIWLLGTKEYRY